MRSSEILFTAALLLGAYLAERNSEPIIKAWSSLRRGVHVHVTIGPKTDPPTIPPAFYN